MLSPAILDDRERAFPASRVGASYGDSAAEARRLPAAALALAYDVAAPTDDLWWMAAIGPREMLMKTAVPGHADIARSADPAVVPRNHDEIVYEHAEGQVVAMRPSYFVSHYIDVTNGRVNARPRQSP